MSLQAMHNLNAILRYAHAMEHPEEEPPVYCYCYSSDTYQVDDPRDQEQTNPDNPFLHLFNPASDQKWEDPKTIKQVYAHKMRDYLIEPMMKEREAWMRNN
jgi:hypothetical protein